MLFHKYRVFFSSKKAKCGIKSVFSPNTEGVLKYEMSAYKSTGDFSRLIYKYKTGDFSRLYVKNLTDIINLTDY